MSEQTQQSLLVQLRKRLFLTSALLIAVILFCMVLGGIAFSFQQSDYREASIIQNDMNELLIGMINQETGMRGYINGGDPILLEPFHFGRASYLAADARLRRELANSSFLSARSQLGVVENRADRWYRGFALIQIQRIQSHQFSSARQPSTVLYGKSLFDSFRRSVAQLQQAEASDVDRLEDQLNLLYGGFILTAMLAVLSIALLLRRLSRRLTTQLSTQLEALNQAAKQFGDGQLSARVPRLEHAELQHIGETMNTMASTLRQRQIELQLALADIEAAQNESVALFQAATEAIIFVSTDQQHLSINRRFSEFFGISPEDVASKPSHNVRACWTACFADPAAMQSFLDESLQDHTQELKQAIHQSIPQSRELECTSSPVYDSSQTYIGRRYVLRDVTQEREIDRMKSEFISLVSHEFRTPLTSIRGFIDLLLDESTGELNEVQLEFLTIVQKNAARMGALVDELLDISRIEAGKVQLTLQPVGLNEIIRSVADAFQPLIAEKQQHLTLHLLPSLPPLMMDANRVTQIVSNLVSNAHKYSPQGATIQIFTHREEDKIRVDVRDSGIGMTPQEQAKLFTKFFRAKNSMTEQVGGTGLGLLITKSLIEMHGGSIEVISAPGQGSTFSFTLPLGTEPVQERSFWPEGPVDLLGDEIIPIPTESGKKRVLVVDDEPDITSLLRRYLERNGYEVIVAHTGQEALLQVSKYHIDFITLDLMLPDINGLTVLEHLRSHKATAETPVLLLSAIDKDGQLQTFSNLEYMVKPFDQDAIIRMIENSFAAGDKQVILIADANAESRNFLHQQLEAAGCRVIEAVNAEEVIACVQTYSPALLLLECDLPPSGCLTVLNELRAQESRQGLSIMLLVGHNFSQEQVQELLDREKDVKLVGIPVNIKDVAQIITRQLAGKEEVKWQR